MARVWLITGASMGFGRTATETVLSHGEIVVAAVRTPSSLGDLASKHSSEELLVVPCDVTNREDIKSAFNVAYAKFGRIDVVFNNAGIAVFAEAETEQEEMAKKVFEVNFWGAGNVMKEAVKSFRERNPPGVGGRLLNSSSAGGLVAIPLGWHYNASKHAFEGFAQTMAKELDPAWNVKITNVEFGAFKTGVHHSRVPILETHPAYTNPSLPSVHTRNVFTKTITDISFGDPKKAMEKVYDLSKLEEPPRWLPLGKDSIEWISDHLSELQAVMKLYSSWSDDLGLEE
ncbi:hypothetical protein ONZ45_g17852 [Pleurotus djamor]|nr:hypothetical protein ONZ45_g17852 [Pleurotus djamor]